MKCLLSALDILTVHHRKITQMTMHTDLKRIGVQIASYTGVQNLHAAQEYLATTKPHLIILDLCLPNGDAYQLLEEYQPSRRNFAVILMDDEHKDNPHATRLRQRGIEALIEHQAAGYLLYPHFHNGDLERSLEQARGRIQARLLDDYQQQIIERLMRTMLNEQSPEQQSLHVLSNDTSPFTAHLLNNEQDVSEKKTQISQSPTPPVTEHQDPHSILHRAQEATFTVIPSALIGQGVKTKRGDTASGAPPKELTLAYNAVIRLENQENYYHLTWFDTKGNVKTALVRKEALPRETFPTGWHQVHRSHIINILHIGEVLKRAVIMRCGTSVPLAEREQQRLQEIVAQLSTQVAVLNDLQALLKQYRANNE